MKRLLITILLAVLFHSSPFTLHPCRAASPVNVTVAPEVVNVTVEQEGAAAVTVTTTVGEVMNVITAGEQGIPGPPGPAGPPGPPGSGGGGSGAWGGIAGTLSDQTDLQTALDSKATLGADVNFNNANFPDYGGIEIGSQPLFKTTLSMSSVNTGTLSSTWLQLFNSLNKVHVQDVINSVGHTFTFGNPHGTEASQIPGLAAVALSNDYADLDNKPVLLRGYDGREIELQTSATHIQWRYLGAAAWIDLVPLASLTGADGDNYGCYITGGITAIVYDKNGSNPAPTMTAFGVELRVNGSVVTPATWSWSVPAGSLLSGSASGSTFTPTVAGTFSVGTADNRVDVTVTYAGLTCKASAPVAVSKVGADGISGADNKQQIYTKISAATTGDVLNTEAGAGDADSFAFRTVRAKGGDIHRTDLAAGQTWIHARPTDAATAPKMGIKNTSGTPVMQFNADGSFTGTLVIR